jgi:hypothetical protein
METQAILRSSAKLRGMPSDSTPFSDEPNHLNQEQKFVKVPRPCGKKEEESEAVPSRTEREVCTASNEMVGRKSYCII